MMSQDKRAILSLSLKHKLNTKISTERELLAAHNGMSLILCSKYFIEAQGYTVEQNKVYQDNKSTILMKNIRRYSRSKITKHIKTR